MKQRITYFLRDPEHFDKDQIQVESDSLSVSRLDAAKEHRLTIGLDELPKEIADTLRQSQDLHIRWTRSRPYSTLVPIVSRTSPGLHVFFTPHQNRTSDRICPTLKKLFSDDLKCNTPSKSFAPIPVLSTRFSHSTFYQYHAPLPSLGTLILYLQQKICTGTSFTCIKSTSLLESASWIDFDYDTISHALTINAFWDSAPSGGTWSEEITLPDKASRIEVGVLNAEDPLEPEEHRIGGFLTILGEDSKPSSTLFSFPSRHHPLSLSQTYTTSFLSPTGLHPTLRLILSPDSLTPPSPNCALHTYLALPSTLFIDKYPLSDPLFLRSHNLTALRTLSGETDLEAPDWVIEKWGSAALFELSLPSSPPPSGVPGQEHTITIPLHLRYLPPSTSAQRPLSVPWPVVFYACPADEGTLFSNNPFDRTQLGYDTLFGPKTMFYHLNPKINAGGVGELAEVIQVPVLDAGMGERVRWGTAGAVLLGTLWVLWKLVGVWLRGGEGEGDGRVQNGKGKGRGKKVE